MSFPTLKTLGATAASAALLVAGAGVATAQTPVPGDDDEGRTALVNEPGVTLEIVDVDREAGNVEYSMTNDHGASLTCEAVNENEDNRPGATVSTEDVIAQGENFYRNHQIRDAGEFGFEESFPFVGGGGMLVEFWPLLQMIPTGSAAGSLSDQVIAQAGVVNSHDQALVRGMAGYDSSFSIGNGDTVERTISLGPPAQGERGDDELGVIVMCGEGGTQGDQQLYVWTAYESGEAPQPEPGTGSLDGGSLGSNGDGSLDGGSLGSNGDGSLDGGSLGSNGPENGDDGNGDDGNGNGDDGNGDEG